MTTNADLKIKLAFEMTKESHQKSYKEALELGMLHYIAEVDPVLACELRIQKYQQLLEEEQQNLVNYKLLSQMKTDSKKKVKAIDPGIDKIRFEKFELRKESIAVQVKKGNIDWKTIANVLMFGSPNEAREWTMLQLQEAELLE